MSSKRIARSCTPSSSKRASLPARASCARVSKSLKISYGLSPTPKRTPARRHASASDARPRALSAGYSSCHRRRRKVSALGAYMKKR
jgi:hypothetical protein